MWFLRFASGQAERQTDRQTYRHADRNNLPTYRKRSNNAVANIERVYKV